jgi:hypothetical protein
MITDRAAAATGIPPLQQKCMQQPPSPPAGSGRLPDFLCLGTQRGGTTTLQKLLERHPQVFLPACKEVHYFSLHAEKDPQWYADHYRTAGPGQLCGDITPYYLFHPEAPRRIRALLPGAKLIVLLRDPMERSLSQYFHSVQLGLEHLPLEEALAAESGRLAGAEAVLQEPGGRHRSHQEHSYLSRSRYGGQIGRYESLFPRRQIQRPERVWRTLERFLGLHRAPPPAPLAPANASGGAVATVPGELRRRLRQELLPTYALMAKYYGFDWL